jgi:hypothetical protein
LRWILRIRRFEEKRAEVYGLSKIAREDEPSFVFLAVSRAATSTMGPPGC